MAVGWRWGGGGGVVVGGVVGVVVVVGWWWGVVGGVVLWGVCRWGVCRWGVCSRCSWVRPRFGRSPRPPSADRPKFRTFSSRHNFLSFFSLLGGPFVEFWWCLKRWGPEVCTFGVLGLSREAPAAPDWPNSRWTKSSMTPGTPSSPLLPPLLTKSPPVDLRSPLPVDTLQITESSHGGSTFDMCSDKSSRQMKHSNALQNSESKKTNFVCNEEIICVLHRN